MGGGRLRLGRLGAFPVGPRRFPRTRRKGSLNAKIPEGHWSSARTPEAVTEIKSLHLVCVCIAKKIRLGARSPRLPPSPTSSSRVRDQILTRVSTQSGEAREEAKAESRFVRTSPRLGALSRP